MDEASGSTAEGAAAAQPELSDEEAAVVQPERSEEAA